LTERLTVACEGIGMDFPLIAEARAFVADVEELMAPREW
jgi:hypothetical protein